MAAAYQQLDALLRDPNTLIFPTFGIGQGGPSSLLQSFWLNQAFDRYINEGADLETELADAQVITQSYMECAANITVDTSDAQAARGDLFQSMLNCATSADPEFSLQ